MKQFLAINLMGIVLYDLRNDATCEQLEANGAILDMTQPPDSYMQSLIVAAYIPDAGYSPGQYWHEYKGVWLDMPQTLWAVFDVTQSDIFNTLELVAVSLDNKRDILRRRDPDYQYEGIGKHSQTGADIPAIELTMDEVAILLESPYFNANADIDIEANRFLISDSRFAKIQIQWIKMQVLQAEATLAEKQAAFSLCANVISQLQFGFISTAYSYLVAVLPAAAFTADMKTALMSRFLVYLNKFPR